MSLARDSAFVVGIGLVATSAFMVALPLGLFAIGAPLVVWAWQTTPKVKPKLKVVPKHNPPKQENERFYG